MQNKLIKYILSVLYQSKQIYITIYFEVFVY